MSNSRTIQSPGVEIREQDRSQITPAIVGTTTLVMGYSPKGVKYEPTELTSVTDLENNFGKPTNEAERYFYYGCQEIINEGGTLIAAKLPYDNGMESSYKYLPLNLGAQTTGFSTGAITTMLPAAAKTQLGTFSSLTGYREISIGSVSNMSDTQLGTLAAGGTVTGLSGFVVVNVNKQALAGTNTNEGLFVTIVDPLQAMLAQRVISDTEQDIMCILKDTTTTNVYNLSLSGTYDQNSVSEDLMRQFPGIEFKSNGADIDTYRSNHITLVVSKTVSDENNEGRLSVVPIESFTGSLDSTDKDPSTGQSVYLADIVNSNSQYVRFYRTTTPTLSDAYPLLTTVQQVNLLNYSTAESVKNINGSQIKLDCDKVFEKVSNLDEYNIDVVVDAGLTTISQYCNTSGTFDPTVSGVVNAINASTDVDVWRSTANGMIDFCKNVRKDCMVVLDAPRQLVVDGNDKFIRPSAVSNTFSNTIGKKAKFITGLNSSYAALYSDWVKMYDNFSGKNCWLPPSVKAAGIYTRNDRIGNIWDAPAGLNRGIIGNVNDLAFSPTDKEADTLYLKSINYARRYPLEGFVLEGQKTTQVKPSAFDRVNVRRLFLRLERFVRQVAKYFCYEPNNIFTRRRFVDTIKPTFESFKAQGGLYDYMIVCDETNNGPNVVDNNELRCSILLKPVRTAEFIVVDFIATRTDANFSELL